MRKTRHTLQREIVYQTILSMPGHVTADMIYERIYVAHPSISRATVYRNLKMLEREKRIMRIDVPGGADCFEAHAQDHYHIRCSCCDRLFDAALPYIPELLERERAVDADFEIQGCNLLFVGLCPDCKRKRAAQAQDEVDDKNQES